jgi:hypothetical protein
MLLHLALRLQHYDFELLARRLSGSLRFERKGALIRRFATCKRRPVPLSFSLNGETEDVNDETDALKMRPVSSIRGHGDSQALRFPGLRNGRRVNALARWPSGHSHLEGAGLIFEGQSSGAQQIVSARFMRVRQSHH